MHMKTIINFWRNLFRRKIEEKCFLNTGVFERDTLFRKHTVLELYTPEGEYVKKVGYTIRAEKGITLHVTRVLTTPIPNGEEEIMGTYAALNCSDSTEHMLIVITRCQNKYSLKKTLSFWTETLVSDADEIKLVPGDYKPSFEITKGDLKYKMGTDGGILLS